MSTIETKLKKWCKRKKGILLAYIFGSSVRGGGFRYDLDVAVLVKDDLIEDGRISLQTKLFDELASLLERRDIDVAILNGAPPLFIHEVIKYGKCVFEKDMETRCDFEVRSELKYFDFEPIRKLFWESLVEKVKER